MFHVRHLLLQGVDSVCVDVHIRRDRGAQLVHLRLFRVDLVRECGDLLLVVSETSFIARQQERARLEFRGLPAELLRLRGGLTQLLLQLVNLEVETVHASAALGLRSLYLRRCHLVGDAAQLIFVHQTPLLVALLLVYRLAQLPNLLLQ